MNINNISKLNFKSSILNITSTADNHGDVQGITWTIKTIKENKKDLFCKEKGSKNAFAIVGDFFMNPAKKGFLTQKELTSGDIQYAALEKLNEEILKADKEAEILYEPGNHCFGAGEDWLFNKIKNLKMKILTTNINRKKTPVLKNLAEEKFVDQTIIEIPDDKNPDKKNKVLFLGITVPSRYFNVRNFKEIKFLDDTKKSDIDMDEKDLTETIKEIRKRVKIFKKKNPKGGVVLLAHIGNKLSGIIAKKVNGINLILNAHDHQDFKNTVNNTVIVSHGHNNKFIILSQLKFDDNGNLYTINEKKIETAQYIKEAKKDSSLQYMIRKYLKKDFKPILYLDENIKNKETIYYDSSIRYKNSILANYITTAIKSAVKEKYPQIDAVGIPSTIIRNSIVNYHTRKTFNNIDLMNMFSGVDESVAILKIGKIKGSNLIELVAENITNNIKSPERLAIIQWSDIQVNKDLIKEINENKSTKTYYDAIKIKNTKTGMYEKINKDSEYCILLPEKYLIKDNEDIKIPKKIRNKFSPIPEKYEDLFKKYLKMENYKINITEEIKEQRIL